MVYGIIVYGYLYNVIYSFYAIFFMYDILNIAIIIYFTFV